MSHTAEELMRRANELGRQATEQGNPPFGCLLADADGNILLEAANDAMTTGNRTGHAEQNLMLLANDRFSAAELADCTLYTNVEPCAMCAGASYWVGVGHIVYGLSSAELHEIAGPSAGLKVSCHTVLEHAPRNVSVEGGLLRDEIAALHREFWRHHSR